MAQPATEDGSTTGDGVPSARSRSRTHTWQPPTSYATAGDRSGIELARMSLDGRLPEAVLDTTPTLRCEGTAVHVGRTTATAQARLVGAADGKLYAHGTATCAVFPLPGAD